MQLSHLFVLFELPEVEPIQIRTPFSVPNKININFYVSLKPLYLNLKWTVLSVFRQTDVGLSWNSGKSWRNDKNKMNKYVHGYSEIEADRLNDQADSLANLLHYDSLWDDDSIILEAGCGVGAQTKTVARKNKNSKFISFS